MFKLGDPQSYTYTFSIYTGKNRDCNVSTDEVGMKMTSPYLHRGQLFVIDNFYASVLLAEQLIKNNLHFGNGS